MAWLRCTLPHTDRKKWFLLLVWTCSRRSAALCRIGQSHQIQPCHNKAGVSIICSSSSYHCTEFHPRSRQRSPSSRHTILERGRGADTRFCQLPIFLDDCLQSQHLSFSILYRFYSISCLSRSTLTFPHESSSYFHHSTITHSSSLHIAIHKPVRENSMELLMLIISWRQCVCLSIQTNSHLFALQAFIFSEVKAAQDNLCLLFSSRRDLYAK